MTMTETAGVKELGHFQITDNRVMISDPCYKRGTWCQGVLDGVRNGQWNASVEMSDEGEWGIRCGKLTAVAEGETIGEDWEKTDIDVGVDSGQAGIFSDAQYRDDEIAKSYKGEYPEWLNDRDEEGGRWYGMCCSASIKDNRGTAGIVPFGVVSSSGYGDGGYDCYIQKKNGEVVAIMIDFLPEDED